MEMIMKIVNFVMANYESILAAVSSILLGVIAISMLIPGDQPEKALKAVVDFIAKFSKKPKAE